MYLKLLKQIKATWTLYSGTLLFLFCSMTTAPNHCLGLDQESLHALPSGSILYDSNQSGSFGIYRGKLQESGFTSEVLIDTAAHEMYPSASSDGRYIAYAVHSSLSRNAPADIWLYHRKTKKTEKLISNASFPRFSSSSDSITFERNRSSVYEYNLKTKESQEIFPKKRKRFSKAENVKPQSSADQRYIAFISSNPERWNIWFLDRKEGTLKNIGKGCEPTWIDGSNTILFVKNQKKGTKLYRYHVSTKNLELLFNDDEHRFYYFPAGDKTGRFILFSKSLIDQQSHLHAPYDIMLFDRKTKRQFTLTKDSWTNRWPRWLPEQE